MFGSFVGAAREMHTTIDPTKIIANYLSFEQS
jgi:hypothetical protein